MINNMDNVIILNLYEEVVGVLEEINLDEIGLLVRIGKLKILLPCELAREMSAFKGQRMGLIKCESGYRFRKIID